MQGVTVRTPEKRQEFLTILASCGNVTEACRIADVSRNAMYMWKNDEPEFAADWDKHLAFSTEILEDEARRRASEGWDEPVFHQGVATGTVRKYSDTLLIFLLKGALPEKYRENSKVEMAGSLNVTNLTDEEIAAKLAAHGVNVNE